MKMKLSMLVVTTIGMTTFISCTRENQSQTNLAREMAFTNRISEFADLHDEGLDYVFEQFSKSLRKKAVEVDISAAQVIVQPPNPTGPPTSASPTLIPQYTMQFMKSKLNLNMDSLAKASPGILEDSMDVKVHLFDHNRYWVSDYMKYLYKVNFSSRLASAINNFQLIVEKNSDTLKIGAQGEGIISYTLPYLSDALEKIILVTMIRVGINSAGYWQRSQTKWTNIANAYYGSVSRGPAIDWKDVIFGDIVGAGGGVLRGAWTGFTIGTIAIPGVGTVSGVTAGALVGMMGGAIGGSATGAFWNYVKEAIDWNSLNLPLDVQIAGLESGDPYIKLMIAQRVLEPLTP